MALYSALGIAAGLVQVAAFLVYTAALRRGGTRPNGVSWLMWTSGSLVPFYIAGDSGAPLSALLAPALCALLSMHVAFCAFFRGPSVPAARHDWGILALDLAILAGYLAWSSGHSPAAGLGTVFLLLPTAGSALSFWPTLRSTRLDPANERPLAWCLWSLSYGLMALAVIAAGMPWPFLVYPVLTLAMNLAVGVLAMAGSGAAAPGRFSAPA